MLGMYYTSMSLGEALNMAAFERYYASVLVYCCGYFSIIIFVAEDNKNKGCRKFASLCVSLLLCMGLVWPNFGYLVPQKMRQPSYEYVYRCRFDSLVEQYKIPLGQTYIVFAEADNEILTKVLCTYLLQPQVTVISSELEPEQLADVWQTYDYYIVLDQSEETMAFVGSMGESELAGYTY